MEYEFSLLTIALLIGTGFIAGFINTIAGGGSMLTLPALMMLGLPADIANATNRVGVFLQTLVGIRGFHRHRKISARAAIPILIPSLLGSLLGALLASFMPVSWLKPALLITMLAMALLMVIRPSSMVAKPGSEALTLKENPSAWVMLFGAGLYGGFVQAGVGFLLIAAVAGGLRYDLLRANAFKLVITSALTVIALAVFIVRGQVLWVPGLVLAIGTMLGASASVRFAIAVPQKVLSQILFAMILLTCLGAWFS